MARDTGMKVVQCNVYLIPMSNQSFQLPFTAYSDPGSKRFWMLKQKPVHPGLCCTVFLLADLIFLSFQSTMKYGMKYQKLVTLKKCCCTEDCKLRKMESSTNDSICPCCAGKKCGLLSVSVKKNNCSKTAKCLKSFSFLSVYK
ncbi:hypothetical protein AVEN_55335-1 [Araneus ventricosus]|uniref:Uncharacterized protein n=1 Tax=Araneus ventricosus TaxID=182803 RepID=A0A4Y2DC92_ARAVE|nr:hypothetical protein AVEN_55335-1 [Araneus ventricosus]